MRKFLYADKFFMNSATRGPGYLEIVEGKFGAYTKELPA